MAYNTSKGKRGLGDIEYEGDPAETQIDFENDFIALKTNGAQRLIVSGSAITASVIFSASSGIHAGTFTGDGSGLTGIPAAGVAPAGSTTQVQYNNGGALGGSSRMVFDGSTLTVQGLASTGNTTLGNASGDSVTINAATVDIPNVAAGTDNTVVVYNGSTLLTDEIDSRVWGSELVDKGNTVPVANQISLWTDSDSIQGLATLTYDGVILAVTGAISASGNISGSAFYGDGSALTGLATYPITTYNNASQYRVLTSVNGTTVQGETGLTYDGTIMVATGHVSASLGITGSSLHTATTVINSGHLSSSLNISGAAFYGDGSTLTGVGAGTMSAFSLAADAGSSQTIENTNTVTIAGGTGLTTTAGATDTVTIALDNTAVSAATYTNSTIAVDAQGRITSASNGSQPAVTTYTNATDNYILTSNGAGSINGETNLTFDGNTLGMAGLLDVSRLSHPTSLFTHPGDNVAGAIINLINGRDGNAGQADDFCGGVAFKAPDSTSTETQYGKITTQIASPTNTVEKGRMYFEVTTGGQTATEYLRLDGLTSAITSSVNTQIQGTTHLSGGVRSKYVYTTSSYTMTANDRIVVFNTGSATTASLPNVNPSIDGATYVIKTIGLANVHITGAAGTDQFIDGQASFTLSQGDAVTLFTYYGHSGYEWAVLNFYNMTP